VALAAGPCEDWRAALKATFEPGRTRFGGRYPAACGEQTWNVADPQPASYEARLLETLWREMGGHIVGHVREGGAPSGHPPRFEISSPPLAAVVRDINKFSNNLMAEQLLLSLGLQGLGGGEGARAGLARWLVDRTGDGGGEVVIDQGSGLSRLNRISASRLARLLLLAWDGPWMSELMSSLPVLGLDGTLRRAGTAAGGTHLKTGSLRDVAALAGFVLSDSGRRYVLVAIVNHPQAAAARPALDALVAWTRGDASGP
jgi:D-alanyl-D-alanine carboxypeptidase/D-alanyl-D-alanine-endopeptidase (penicillin-binding protein 4)